MDKEQFLLLTYKPNNTLHDWKFDSNLDVYTNDLAKATELPKPQTSGHAVQLTLSDKKIHECLQSVDVSDSTTMKSLVHKFKDQFATEHLPDADTVCLLYEWLTTQDLTNKSFLLTSNFESVTFQLRKLQQGETSYAAMFTLLCNLANIPCVIIRGLIKAGPDKIGEGEWNAAYVDGQWRLVDAFWGAYSIPSLYLARHYLFPDPEQFRYSHWSESPLWQMLANPISKQKFTAMEYLTEKFFRMKMTTLKNNNAVLTTNNGEMEIQFSLQDPDALGQVFHCFLSTYNENEGKITVPVGKQMDFTYKKTSKSEHNETNYDDPNPAILGVHLRFPQKGKYRLEICGESLKEKQDLVAIYIVNVNDFPGQLHLFPEIDMKGWGPSFYTTEYGFKAKSYPYSIITANAPLLNIDFELTEPEQMGKAKLMYHVKEIEGHYNYEDMEGGKQHGNVVSIEVNASCISDFELVISADVDGAHIENMCTYYVDTHWLLSSDKYKDMISCLKMAIKLRTSDKLKEAIDHVKTDGYDQDRRVKRWYQQAYDLYEHVRNYEMMLGKIQTVDGNTILTLKSFTTPETVIVKVMRATFLVLGTPSSKLGDWDSIRKEITSIGKSSVQRRISELKIENLKKHVVLAAEHEMEGFNAVQLTGTSQHVASFAKWLESIFQICRPFDADDDDDDDDDDYNDCVV